MQEKSIAINWPASFSSLARGQRPKISGLTRLGVLAVAFIALALGTHPACAQVDQGTITGIVQDSSGAIIAGAQVTLSDTDTGLVSKAQSSSGGVFVFSPVKIGHYPVSAKGSNFQTTLQENLTLHVSETLNIAMVLSFQPLQPSDVGQSEPDWIEQRGRTDHRAPQPAEQCARRAFLPACGKVRFLSR